MPSILLSACGSETAAFCNGAQEDTVMHGILHGLAEYLQASGLRALRRPPEVPAAAAAALANRRQADLLFCLRSYAAPKATAGAGGSEICYHPASAKSQRAAELLCTHLGCAAPARAKVRAVPAPGLPEFHAAHCPAVHVRLGCRDDDDDAQWMLECPGVIARALAKALAAWFEVPCKAPFDERPAVVRAPEGSLALRCAPGAAAPLLRTLPNGAAVLALHREGAWQFVDADGACGFVMARFLT